MYEFTNRKTGEKLRCAFRLASADTPELLRGLQTCVRDEYGETYIRPNIYDLQKLSEEVSDGLLAVYLAVNEDGDPVSSLALCPCEGLTDVLEMGIHVVRRRYRGFGVGTVLTRELLNQQIVKNCTAVVIRSATFHILSQHQTISCGLVPCGFLFLEHSNEAFKYTFDTNGCLKHTLTVAVCPELKCDVGTLYLPEEHAGFISRIYDRLNVRYTLSEGHASQVSSISCSPDETQHTLTLWIFRGGKDLDARVRKILEKPHHPQQTINAFVDMNDPGAADTYRTLRQHGFIFAGIHPLCGNGEFMLLHHSMNMTIEFDKLCIDDGYREVFDYIRGCAGGKT